MTLEVINNQYGRQSWRS